MQCKDVEIAVEREGLAPLPEAARAHLAGCRHCRELVEDFATIVAVAKELSLEVEPPLRPQADPHAHGWLDFEGQFLRDRDRKSTRLNSSHPSISYAVFCLKKKKR